MINFPHKVIISNDKIAGATSWCTASLGNLGGVWVFDSYGPSANRQLQFKFALAKHAMLFELVWKY